MAPRGFAGTEEFFDVDVWLPFHAGPAVDGYTAFENRATANAWVFGRLRPGISRAQADGALQHVSRQMAKEYPKEDQGKQWHTAPVGLLGESLGTPIRGFVAGVAALALLVLLAACANLGILFSSRTTDRARELGIRLAIGSSRGRILRRLAMEPVLIAMLGAALASVFARALLHGMSQWQPPSDLPLMVLVDADWRVYLASAVLAVATGLIFGMLPARQIWRTDPNHTMRASGSTAVSDHSLLRSGLLLVQIALCCLLVTASLVAFRGLERTVHVPLGFEPEGVTLATVDVRLGGYTTHDEQVAAQRRLLDAVKAIPGVTVAAYSDNQPLSINTNTDELYAPGTTSFDHAHIRATAMNYKVSPDYFAATGTKLIAGRPFTEHDHAGSSMVAILNETLARRLFGTADVVGKHYPTGEGKETEVVGVVADGKYLSLSEDPTPTLFRPMLQSPDSTAVLIARSGRSPAEMTIAMRKAVASVDSAIPIFNLSSWPDALQIMTFPARAATLALGVMGGLAVMLAVTGIFGVATYSVAGRMRELGIRVALGARRSGVLRAALGRTMLLLAAGSIIGLILGFFCSRLLASVVYHASASDPLLLSTVVFTMLGLGVAAAAVPARRALRVEPAQLLREQ